LELVGRTAVGDPNDSEPASHESTALAGAEVSDVTAIRNWKTGELLFDVQQETLRNADLRGANLVRADLKYANLSGADLCGARLRSADLSHAKLRSANLEGADLRGANLTRADLTYARLSSSDLSRAILTGVSFYQTDLAFAKLFRASLGYASFSFCESLVQACRLDSLRHNGPSSLDHHTLKLCTAGLPDAFLAGVGYTQDEVRLMRAMYGNSPKRYVSCFISHAEADGAFADRIYADLRANNVSCWHYFHDMRGGQEWREQVYDAIRHYDKLILVCSRRSVYRPNVVMEILRAIDEERTTGVRKLFPLRLDDHILGQSMMGEAREKVRSGEWRENWVYYVTQYHIPDFSRWADADEYQVEFAKLLEALEQATK
jgi:hypothetical protein